MCIQNNVPMPADDVEEIEKPNLTLGIIEDQALLADDNRNRDLTLGKQQRDKIVRYLFNRNNVL